MALAHLVAIAAVGAVLAAGGCYRPELRDCTVRCSAPTDCTGGQICNSDGWCAMSDVKDCDKRDEDDSGLGTIVDAAASPMPDAASNLCQLGCSNGTCVDGVCVIDCSAPNACQADVLCPANLPCRVVCGDHACTRPIKCGLATSCEVRCLGDFACQDEIQCNANRCDVDCTGASSCERRTRCSSSCACDVRCIGAGSCLEASECPASSCKLGNGCTSLLAGCNDC